MRAGAGGAGGSGRGGGDSTGRVGADHVRLSARGAGGQRLGLVLGLARHHRTDPAHSPAAAALTQGFQVGADARSFW